MRSPGIAHALLLALGLSIAAPSTALALQPWVLPKDQPLTAEQQKQLRDLVSDGAAASAKDDWEGAREALFKAWQIKRLAAIAANLGYVEVKLGRHREAAEHLKFFLDRVPADQQEKRTAAEQQYAECQKHITVISVITNVGGARVAVDKSEVGVTPLGQPLFVDPGTYSIEVTRTGYLPEQRTISADAAKDMVLQFTLRAEPAPSPPAAAIRTTSPQPVAHESSGLQPRTWALIGGSAATAVSLGFGIGYAIRAHSLNNDAESTIAQIEALPDTTPNQIATQGQCHNRTGTAQTLCEDFLSTRDKQATAINVSTAAFVTAGVLGVATAAAYFLWPTRSSTGKAASMARFQLVPLSVDRAQGAQIHVTF